MFRLMMVLVFAYVHTLRVLTAKCICKEVHYHHFLTLRYCVASSADGPLASASVRSFVEQLAARTSAPGGGSASACIASMVSTQLL